MEDVALIRVTLADPRAKLNGRQQAFLVLRLQGYSVGQIALLMGVTHDAACGLLRRIRQKAGPVLEEDGTDRRQHGRRPSKRPAE